MKKIKRIISTILTLSMIVALCPVIASASMNINIGDYVQMGTYYGEPILWRCVDIDENGPLMLSDKILCIKKFDSPTNENSETGSHSLYPYISSLNGSNYWSESNIRSWLNSDAIAGNVDWICGNPPVDSTTNVYDFSSLKDVNNNDGYDNESGFLSNFSVKEQELIKSVKQKSIVGKLEIEHNIYTMGSESYKLKSFCSIAEATQNYDNAYAEYVKDKMFLLDVKQIDQAYDNVSILGENYFSGYPSSQCVNNCNIHGMKLSLNKNTAYWLRTPIGESEICSISTLNDIGGFYAFHSLGVRPAFYLNLSSSTINSGSGSESSPYTITEEKEIKVNLNGKVLSFEQPPVNYSGTVLVPIRTFEEIGATVNWDGNTSTATVTKENVVVKAQINNRFINRNGTDIIAGEISPQNINSTTMVPIRAISEALGSLVDWDGDEQTVNIYYSDIIDYILYNKNAESVRIGGTYISAEMKELDNKSIFNNYKYCYDYYNQYYSNDFYNAFCIAFDDPTLPLDTLIENVFDITNVPNKLNSNSLNKQNIDTSQFYTKKNVAICLANTINDISGEDIDLFSIDNNVKTIVSKLSSTSGLILSEDKTLSEIKMFSEFLKGMNTAIKIESNMTGTVENALRQYGVSKSYLNSMEEALTETGLMNDTLKESITSVQFEYDNWFIKQFTDLAINKYADKAVGSIASLSNGAFSYVSYIMSAYNKISNNDSRSDAIKSINSYMIYSLPLNRCYTFYANKIASGEFSTNDVILCERTFDLSKGTRLSEYKCAKKLDDIEYNTISHNRRINKTLGMTENDVLNSGIESLNKISYKN